MDPRDYDLLLRSFDDALSVAEHEQLQRRLEASPEARERLKELHVLRRLVRVHAADAFAPAFAERVQRQLARQVRPGRSFLTVPDFTLPRWRWAGVAFAVVIILTAVGFARWLRPTVITAPRGEQVVAALPDGSSVELSSGATLTYHAARFASRRYVQLEGEAFFTVEKAPVPFVVATFNAHVTVRGTRFNVRAWPSDAAERTTVTLASGRVEVAARTAPQQTVMLSPGEATTVKGDAAAPSAPAPAVLERALAWRSGALAFDDEPLSEVFRELERRFGVEIRAASPEVAETRLGYWQPHPGTLAEVLSDICFTRNLRYRRTANGYEVLRD